MYDDKLNNNNNNVIEKTEFRKVGFATLQLNATEAQGLQEAARSGSTTSKTTTTAGKKATWQRSETTTTTTKEARQWKTANEEECKQLD